MQLSKRIIAVLLTVSLLLSLPITVWAAPSAQENAQITPETVEIPVTTNTAPTKEQRLQATYEAHDAKADRKQFSQFNLQPGATMLGNDYIEFRVEDDSDGEMGRFTIGNVEGNPNYTSDDHKILLYGHSHPGTSFTTIQIDNTTYIFNADSLWYDTDTLTAVATMTVENVLITQTLQIVESSGGGIADTVKINYQVQNQSGVSKNIGVRIMMDTMLGYNDGAPFKVPSLGNVTEERELVGNDVPQFWQCFDNLEDPSVFAVGTFYKPGERKPDKVQFTNWANVYDSYHAWNYTVSTSYPVTGDSAVSAYWNPVSVANNGSFSVCTYYGVGYATSDDSTSTQLGNDSFSVQIVDENGAHISGATVTAQNLPTPQTKTTDRGGLANFTALPAGTEDTRTVTLKVEKEGYRTITVDRAVTKGGLTSATLYPNDGNAHVISVTAEFNQRSIDLLSGYKHFKENAADTEAAEDESNVKWLNITVDAIAGSSSITKYQLMQGGEVKVESNTPSFRIPVLTGTPSDPDKYGADYRIDKLDAGKNVYLRLVDASGNATPQKPIGIKVSKPTVYGMGNTDGNLEFGRELKISVPSYIPILGDSDIELGWSGLPFKFCITEEGKVKFAINPKTDLLTGEVDWGNAEKEFETKQLDAVGDRLLEAMKPGGGKPTKFGAGKLSVDAEVLGYGEGYIDENGNVHVEVGLVITINQEAGYTWTFFLGYVPVYIAVGEKVTLTGEGKLNIVGSNGNISVTNATGSINPKITLNVDGGVGANGVLNIGASGRATLSWLHRFNDNYNLVDLTGGVYIVAQAFLFKAEKKLAEGTWTIYEGYGSDTNSVAAQVLAQSTDFYNSDSYVQLERDYLTAIAPFAADSEIVKTGVYSDASPMLVKAGDTAYLFWLEDITTRDASNRTALVYATSTDLESWSAPVQIFEESEGSTADFNFDICVDGSNIHLALCKENTVFTEETATLDAMAAASEIYYAKLNTETGAVTTQQLTDNNYADTMPQIVVHNGNVVVAYSQNRMEDGFFGSENTHTVMYTTVGTGQTQSVSVDALISDIALSKLNGETTVAYVLDTDRNYNTEEDTQLWVYNGSQNTLLAEAGSSAASAVFTKLDGEDVLMWYANNNVCYTDGTGTPQVVFEDLPYNFNRNFFAIEGDDHTELVWVGTTGTQDDYQSAAYAVSYRNGRWSETYKMFDTESELTLTLDGYSEGGNTYVTYLKTYGVQEDNPIPSLCVSTVTPEYNLSLLNYSYEDAAVAPGQNLPFSVTVKNNGNEDIDNFYLHIYNASGFALYSAHIENADLARGATKSFTVDNLILPSWLDNAYAFTVRVECDNESNYDDNSASFTMGYTDLTVETSDLLINGEDSLNIVVKNLTGIQTDATLRIQADSTEGAVLYEKRLTDLNNENVTSVLVNLNRLSSGSSIDKYYVTVNADAEELLKSDNTQMIYRALTNEQMYTLNVSAGNGGHVTGDIGGTFCAGQQLTVTTTVNRGYRFLYWTSDCDIEFSDPTSLTTSFTMPSKNANVSAVFEDVAIYLYVNEGSVNLHSEDTFLLSYSTSTNEDIADSLFWTTSNPDVATVDENGLVTAVGDGYAEITLTSADNRIIPATCYVYVSNDPYIQLYLDDYDIQLETGGTFQLGYACDLEEDISDTLYWETSNSEVVTVENGLITAVGAGQATITLASTDGRIIPATCNVTVRCVIHTNDFTDLESDHPYADSLDQTWKFRIPCASAITLTFDEQSELESYYDWLHITSADQSFDTGYSGTELAGATITVPGDEVILHLTTDSSVTFWGFKITNAVAEGYAHNTDGPGGTCTGCYTGWQLINNKWYYSVDGIMQTGWLHSGTTWYYLKPDGAMAVGWQLINNKWYYFQSSGAMQTGWLQSGTTWYYLQQSGAMAVGWQQVNGKWYYFQSSGAMKTGWLQTGTTWYYLQQGGAMVTGSMVIDGKLSNFAAGGAWQGYATPGWKLVGATWYYVGADGTVTTGWKNIGGKYYYFNTNGAMQTGWLQSGTTWYYLQSSGAMATGWKNIGGKYYYFNTSGAMQTGWLQSGTTWYYLQQSGAMAVGWQQVNGKWYYFQSSGAMQTGWLQLGSSWYYFQASGAMVTGTVKIGSKTYNFSTSGACLNP